MHDDFIEDLQRSMYDNLNEIKEAKRHCYHHPPFHTSKSVSELASLNSDSPSRMSDRISGAPPV